MATPTKLIVMMAFDRDAEGELRPAFEPQEMPSEGRAISAAKALVGRHAGVIAWSREAQPDIGEYGPPHELFRHGDVADLE
jgi:hypothetical protein